MGLSRKKPTEGGPKLGLRLVTRGGGLPPRIVLFVIVRDDSGSMGPWRTRSGEFIPQVRAAVVERGGPKVEDLINVMTVAVSGGVTATDFTTLRTAVDPVYTPDGQTPIGEGLQLVSDKLTAFLEGTVFPQEVTVRNLEVLLLSDLMATGETPEQTEEGVAAFVAAMKKFRGNVTVVVPNAESFNKDLAGRLDLNERGVRYLDADPKSILNITFDSLLQASRKLTGSNPRVRPQ